MRLEPHLTPIAVPVGIMFCGGRVYTLSMVRFSTAMWTYLIRTQLFNLNVRSPTKPGSSRGTSSNVRTPRERTSVIFARDDTQNFSGIRVLLA
jgi:hypothetical protein